MIYELREYTATPGSADRLHARFADHTLGLFARHGLDVRGFWVERDDPERLVYLLAFADEAQQKTAWDAFLQDPEWQRVRSDSEVNGSLVAEVRSRVLNATPYWSDPA